MDEDPVQPREYLPAVRFEVFRKRLVRRAREEVLVVDLQLDPVHEQRDVLVRRQVGRFFVFVAVRPEVFEAGAAGHRRAALVGAVLRCRAVDQVDSVEEIDN